MTDRDHDTMRSRFGEDIDLVSASGADALDFMSARFRIAQSSRFDTYQPILYVDTDMVCDSPIEVLLKEILKADRVCVCDEREIDIRPYFGWDLFENDPDAKPRGPNGFTTGILGWPNMQAVSQMFDMIISTIYARARQLGNRKDWGCYDQPVANYIVNKTQDFDNTALRNAGLLPDFHHMPASMQRHGGFLHFCGNVGGAHEKIEGMKARYDMLLAEANVGDI